MALVPDQKFSTFTNGNDLAVGDIVVGLRNGLNTRFNYTGALPVGVVVPITQGGTGATTAAGARTNLGLGTMATQDASNIAITGGSVSATSPAPVNAADIANKGYVDTVAAGFHWLAPVKVATTANFAATYNNGASGVGATLTATSNGAISIDGISLVLNDTVLVKDQTTTYQNGIYYVSQVGDASNPAILTRADYYDQPSEINPGDLSSVLEGTINAQTFWAQTATVTAIGSDPITFVIFGIDPSDIVTLSGTQTIVGAKTFSSNTQFADINATNKYSKNILIGGDFSMNPWQRGTVFNPIVNNQLSADRWKWAQVTTTAAVTIQQTADAPTVAQAGFYSPYCLEMVVTTADAVMDSGDILSIYQAIEGYNILAIAQRTFTLSFWIKSNITGTGCVAFRNSGGDRSYVSEVVINNAATWEKKTVVISASPSAGTWNYTTGVGLYFSFSIMAGSTYQTGTPNTWVSANARSTANQTNFAGTIGNYVRIWGLQIESGSLATPFEQRTRQQEIDLCQRYTSKTYDIGTTPGTPANYNGALTYYAQRSAAGALNGVMQKYPCNMRASPTITFYRPDTGATTTTWYNRTRAAISGTITSRSSGSNQGMFQNSQLSTDNNNDELVVQCLFSAEL